MEKVDNKNEEDIRIIKCPKCGNETKFDLTKVPINVKFDYKCKKCGIFHMVKLVVTDENLIKKYNACYIANRNKRIIEYFNENIFTIENKADPFWELEARKIGEQIVERLADKSIHFIMIKLSNLNSYEKVEKYFEDNDMVVTAEGNIRKSVIGTFVEKALKCAKILVEKNNNGVKW